MGVLIDGSGPTTSCRRKPESTGQFKRVDSRSATVSPPTAHPASRPRPAAIISMSRTAVPGRTAR